MWQSRSRTLAFELDRFLEDCRSALAADRSYKLVCNVVARAVAEPRVVVRALGEPRRAALQTLHRSPEFTVLNVVWAPHWTLMPHDHRMWAVIGVYSGREDNIFWRRVSGAPHGLIEARGARSLCEGDAEPLAPDVIHSVTNPIGRLTGAIHVYGGNFFTAERSEWDPETLIEGRFDSGRAVRRFDEANRTLGA